jgi:carbon storage regulator CsrA
MLVLSRRPNEKLLIPSINTAVQIVSIKPGVVRLGIEAPPEVTIYREEVLQEAAGRSTSAGSEELVTLSRLRELHHQLGNRLSVATLGLARLRDQLQSGLTDAWEATLDQVDDELQALRQQFEQTVTRGTPRVRPRKALLVEDDHNERELLAGFLRLAGLDVATAGDGCDALRFLRAEGRPDVLLLDMILPRCDGPTTVREIRRDPRLTGLKIFGISGHPSKRFDLPKGSSGVDRWFVKPLNPQALLTDLHRELADVP